MSKMKEVFGNRKAVIVFLTCGDPDLETTAAAVRAAAKNGADLIALGIPFSDPTVEGPEVAAANFRALQGGVTTDRILAFVRRLHRETAVPVMFAAYANVVFSYGIDQFLAASRECGVDGLLLSDLPFEEKEEFLPACRAYGVDLISQIASASQGRIARIAEEAEGFLYIVPSNGQAGREQDTDLDGTVKAVRRHAGVPCVIATDFSEPVRVKEAAELSDGVFIGSAVVRLLEKYGKNAPRYIGEYVKTVRKALASADDAALPAENAFCVSSEGSCRGVFENTL